MINEVDTLNVQREFESLYKILTFSSDNHFVAQAEVIAKRYILERVGGQSLPVHAEVKTLVGSGNDYHLFVLLASLGEEVVFEKVRKVVQTVPDEPETRRWLKLLIQLGSSKAYEQLQTYAGSESEVVSKVANDLLRKHPEDWPRPTLTTLFF